MNSKVVKFLIELATSIVKVIDKVGLLNVAFSAFIAKTTFKGNKFGQIFKLDIDEQTNKIKSFGLNLGSAAVGANALSIGTKAAAIGTQLLNSALSMGISLLVGWGIQAFIGWLDNVINATDKLKEKVQELSD